MPKTRPPPLAHTLVAVVLAALATLVGAEAPSTSPLWGSTGETWDRERLMDWSSSGYAGKDRPPTEPPFVANVLDFGALGDGKTDCTEPFRAAIDQVANTGGGTILIPRGKYRVTKRLVLSKSNVVLKGEGNDTVLYFPHSLSQVDGVDVEKHLSSGYLQSPYAWRDGFVQITGMDPGSADHASNTGWVVRDSKMGQRHLFLDSTEGLAPGQWVRILQSDTAGSLTSYLYGTDYTKMSKALESDEDCEPTCASDISDQRDLIRWATRCVSGDLMNRLNESTEARSRSVGRSVEPGHSKPSRASHSLTHSLALSHSLAHSLSLSRILSIEEGNLVVLQRSLPTDVSPGWKARLLPVPSSMPKESGIRDLTIGPFWSGVRPSDWSLADWSLAHWIANSLARSLARPPAAEFPFAKASRHHYDVGYNGVLVSNAFNIFVLNVDIRNADQGLLVQNSQMVTVDGIRIESTSSRQWSRVRD